MSENDQICIPTDEQQKRTNELERIFLPHSRSLRDLVFGNGTKPFARFVHYTSAEATLKIISSKNLWLRNTLCMSDYREVQLGFSILKNYFADAARTNLFINTVNECTHGKAEDALKLFDQWWTRIQLNTHITSLSEHEDTEDIHGRLSMWRGFGAIGANTARVAIVFKVPAKSKGAVALKLRFSPVAYLREEQQKNLIPEVISNIKKAKEFLASVTSQEIINWIFLMLLTNVTCIKHEGFREEREWRVVHCPQLDTSSGLVSSIETVFGVPQLIYKLPLDGSINSNLDDIDLVRIFDRIIIGPTPYPAVMGDAFVEALSSIGVADAAKKVFASGIPIRA